MRMPAVLPVLPPSVGADMLIMPLFANMGKAIPRKGHRWIRPGVAYCFLTAHLRPRAPDAVVVTLLERNERVQPDVQVPGAFDGLQPNMRDRFTSGLLVKVRKIGSPDAANVRLVFAKVVYAVHNYIIERADASSPS
ncbi:hypothetical protein BDY17DRAFT_294166 [Neohortaea acidophila]|uniref:Uncharacterized protein n=1 Tax=Neohortaea acidophila TaxID=245834 RepID=A0A6A6Q176_9PEZI|nr:uncharacterized protein BDY17DRAFT_294166 [Neohortaea acidophila]KAF2485746.1 hypothetical protein BDY17DRAFT_294166 [Neohortaea acidophila]